MVEWRMDVEIRREKEKARREEVKRPITALSLIQADDSEKRGSTEKQSTIVPAGANDRRAVQLGRRSSVAVPPGQPRPPVIRTQKSRSSSTRSAPVEPVGPPPAYSNSPPPRSHDLPPMTTPAPVAPVPTVTPRTRSRATSVSEVLAGAMSRRHTLTSVNGERDPEDDTKGDWASSDDEAINVMAAPSGSQLLDERTSAMAAAAASPTGPTRADMPRSQTAPSLGSRSNRRSRPANLDLSLTRQNTNVISGPPPSPTPTLLTLQQALSIGSNPRDEVGMMSPELDGDADGEEDEDGEPNPPSPTTPTRERITLAEALFESRLPNIPPAGSRREQEPIIIHSQTNAEGDAPASPRTSESNSVLTRQSTGDQFNRRRRRWSVLGGVFSNPSSQSQSSIPTAPDLSTLPPPQPPAAPPEIRERRPNVLVRSHSGRVPQAGSNIVTAAPGRPLRRPSTSPGLNSDGNITQMSADPSPSPSMIQPHSAGPSHSRFLPRILTNALARRSDDVPPLPRTAGVGSDKPLSLPPPPHAPAPKLEYVKLPGTKGAVAVKAVETAKKR